MKKEGKEKKGNQKWLNPRRHFHLSTILKQIYVRNYYPQNFQPKLKKLSLVISNIFFEGEAKAKILSNIKLPLPPS